MRGHLADKGCLLGPRRCRLWIVSSASERFKRPKDCKDFWEYAHCERDRSNGIGVNTYELSPDLTQCFYAGRMSGRLLSKSVLMLGRAKRANTGSC
jgi:hypothetical protein